MNRSDRTNILNGRNLIAFEIDIHYESFYINAIMLIIQWLLHFIQIAASFKSSYNGRVDAVLTIWHFTKWLVTYAHECQAISLILAHRAVAAPILRRRACCKLHQQTVHRKPRHNQFETPTTHTNNITDLLNNQLKQHIRKYAENVNLEF